MERSRGSPQGNRVEDAPKDECVGVEFDPPLSSAGPAVFSYSMASITSATVRARSSGTG